MKNKISLLIFSIITAGDIILWGTGKFSSTMALPILLIIGIGFYGEMKFVNRKDDIYNGKFQEHFKDKEKAD